MQDDLSRLVGRQGFEVKRVIEVGDQLDLEASWSRVAAVARLWARLARHQGPRRGCGCTTCRWPGA